MTLLSEIEDFRNVVEGIYGTYLDTVDGFGKVYDDVAKQEAEAIASIEELKQRRPDLAHLSFGGMEIAHGRTIPAGSPSFTGHLHQVSSEVILERNRPNGENHRLVAAMIIVTLYQYWDEHYRDRIATKLGTAREHIVSDLFGDLRYFRNAIIHRRGKATRECEKTKLLKWFKYNDPIEFTKAQVEEIIDRIFDYLRSIEGGSKCT